MPLETIFQELPKATIEAHAEKTLNLTFSQVVKLLELTHTSGVTLKHVVWCDKTFEGDAYKDEVVPGSEAISVTLVNNTDKEIVVRAGFYVEIERNAMPLTGVVPMHAPAVAASSLPSSSPAPAPPPAMHVPTASQPNDPFMPPPPGASKSFELGDQKITVTTPAEGAPLPALNGTPARAQAPGTVESYQMGNQQIRVSAPAAHAQTAHSEVIAAVVAPRVRPGPETVTVGMDEIAILIKRSEGENLLKILNGAIMHPAFCMPIVGAVQRALGY